MQGLDEETRVLEESYGKRCRQLKWVCGAGLVVRECRELEEGFGTCFTKMITSKKECCLREMKKAIIGVDRRMLLEKCAEKAPMIAKVAEHQGWANS